MEIVFQNPVYLWFLISIILLVFVHTFTLKHVKRRALKFANFDAIARVTGKPILGGNVELLGLRLLTLAFAIFALAGTTIVYLGPTNTISYVLAIDASSSMSSDDFMPNRIEAAKVEAVDFINSLSSETQVGIISFSGSSFIEQSLTKDLQEVKETILDLKISKIGGTDIGDAIVASSTLLSNEEKGKVIILLTDGQSNIGLPISDAISYANENNVIVYTIGIGTEEGGKIRGLKAVSKLDEQTMINIAGNTGGEYFRATDQDTLKNAYRAIASSTKAKIRIDLTTVLMTLALLMLFIEWALTNTKYRTIP